MSRSFKHKQLGNHSHYLKEKTIDNHLQDLIYIHNQICFILYQQYPNFDGLDFCDVSANGIQVRLHHKQIPNYTYHSVTLDYNFSNINDVINTAIDIWSYCDNEQSVKQYQDFLSYGERYGWD